MNSNVVTSKKLHRLIMRRVWYSYLVTIFFSLALVRGVVLGSSIVAFCLLVSIPNIIQNFMAVEVGNVPMYVRDVFVQAFLSGEFLTLLTLGIVFFSIVSFGLPRRTMVTFKETQSA